MTGEAAVRKWTAGGGGGRSIGDRLRKLVRLGTDLRLESTLEAARDEGAVIARWWRAVPNWGDAINPVLIRHLSGRDPIPYDEVLNLRNRPVHSVVGSMLDGSRVRNLVVWGSGFMHRDSRFPVRPREIHAVRGPLTRELILRQGLDCPDVYGDPALLYPRFYRPEVATEYGLGIVPHLQDRLDPVTERFRERPDVLVIDIFGGIRRVVDEICRCRAIASSSLHGLVAADAYGVPSAWIKISDRVRGGSFKFRDYFLSLGRPEPEPLIVTGETPAAEILDRARERPFEIDLERLLEACPFRSRETKAV